MNKRTFKVSKKAIELRILIISIFFISCVNFPYVDFYLPIKYLLMGIDLFILFKHLSIFIKKKYLEINSLVLLWGAVIILSSILNRKYIVSRNIVLSSIIFIVMCMEVLATVEYVAENSKIDLLFKIYYKLTLLLVIITDILIIKYPNMFLQSGYGTYYLVGSKFNVMYLHMQLIVLILIMKKRDNKIKKSIEEIIWIIISFVMAKIVDCNTGLIGCFILLIFIFLLKSNSSFWISPKIFIGSLILSSTFVVIYDIVLQNKFLQNFIVNVLGKSLTLTGRTDIYMMLPMIITKHLWLGYGYGSAFEVSMKMFGYANVQNGLVQWLVNCGIIGTLLFLYIIWLIFSFAKKNICNTNKAIPIIAILYAFSILATIEITLENTFIFWLFIVVGIANEKNIRKES